MTTPTTTETYDGDLLAATEQLDARLGATNWPEGEREKTIADTLNNTWIEGLTLAAWVSRAASQLGV